MVLVWLYLARTTLEEEPDLLIRRTAQSRTGKLDVGIKRLCGSKQRASLFQTLLLLAALLPILLLVLGHLLRPHLPHQVKEDLQTTKHSLQIRQSKYGIWGSHARSCILKISGYLMHETLSTFALVLADVSTYWTDHSSALVLASSADTCLLSSKSDLFPTTNRGILSSSAFTLRICSLCGPVTQTQ